MTVAAYDDVADWYETWVAASSTAVFGVGRELFPADLGGQRVLDVACGQGRLSRELAAAGAEVVGVDISPAMLAKATAVEAARPFGISYLLGDVAAPQWWWDGRRFDGAASEMAFMDIADLTGTVRAVATAVRPGGWFVCSLVHPCFPGGESGLSSWPPARGYTAEGFWTSPDHNPDGVRIRLGSYHRTLATYLNTFIDAGLQIQRLAEAPTPVPQTLLVACRRV